MSDANAPAASGIAGLDMEALQKSINETINRAVGARLSRDNLSKTIEEKIAAALGGDGISKAVEAAIVKMVEATPAEPQPSTGAATPPGNPAQQAQPAAPQQDPKVGELERKLKAFEKQLADERAKAEKAESTAKAQRIHTSVEAALLPHVGNNAKLAKLIAKELAANVDEPAPGALAWKRGEEEPVAFADGFKQWLASPEAKELLPAQQRNIPPANFYGTPSGYPERSGQAAQRGPNPILDEMRRGLQTYAPDPTGNAPSSLNK